VVRDEHRPTDAELTLMAHVARKHYIGGMSKTTIAKDLFLSRFKVARLLDAARDNGIVQFTVGLPGNVNLNLCHELEDAFRLRRAVVIDDPPDDAALFRLLGDATVDLLAEVIEEGDAVGIASTRTMMGIRESRASIARCTFVQLTGQLPRADADDVISSIRSLTLSAAGTAHVFYAPMIAASESARENYLQQPETATAFGRFGDLQVLVTGVGAWAPGRSVIFDNLPADIRQAASRAGTVADIAGTPVDRHGVPVDCEARRRTVTPDVRVLGETRDRIAVVFDPERAAAVRIAINSGAVNTIVTHRAHAEALLAL